MSGRSSKYFTIEAFEDAYVHRLQGEVSRLLKDMKCIAMIADRPLVVTIAREAMQGVDER